MNKLSTVGVVEELFEEGSAMLTERYVPITITVPLKKIEAPIHCYGTFSRNLFICLDCLVAWCLTSHTFVLMFRSACLICWC